ncbi:hypothetical protein ACFU7Z_03015 [Kitasatospora sp. NPDC057518]|uniref:hypothetical protein n=1 Tax=Kitasatospora sp. NPDC057518 TaxID=3346155 RepID=UPI0036780C2F
MTHRRAADQSAPLAVVGADADAFTALACLAQQEKGTHAVWVLRRGITSSTYGGGTADELPECGALGLRAQAAVEDGHANALTGFRAAAVEPQGEQLVLVAEGGGRSEPVDQAVALAELRVHADYARAGELREFARAVLPEADDMAVKLLGGS